MSSLAQRITDMIDILPEDEQTLAYEIVKRMVLAWDPDFTKVTQEESQEINRSIDEMRRGECVSFASAEEMAAHLIIKG